MIILEGDPVIYCDCDDTLVMWGSKSEEDDTLEFNDPQGRCVYNLTPHQKHINLLKRYKSEGKKIVIWSAGGWDWAKEVVRVLQLEEYVDLIISKPVSYIDDLPCKEFMGQRIYIKETK